MTNRISRMGIAGRALAASRPLEIAGPGPLFLRQEGQDCPEARIGRGMRILWVKVGGLWPLNTGGRLRSFHIISELSHRHRVIVLTTCGPADDPDRLAKQLPRCERVEAVPYIIPKRGSVRFTLAVLRSWLSSLPVDLFKFRVSALSERARQIVDAGEVDLCVADFLSATPNVPFEGRVPVLLFAHNVEYMIWKRLAQNSTSAWQRALLEIEWRKLRRWETEACRRADLTIAVSEVDRALLTAATPAAKIRTIPTGVDLSYFTPDGSREKPASLVFTGSMDWYPNEDAALYFMEQILPSIRRDVPEVFMSLVGRNPSLRLRAAAGRAGVRITGTVEDVRPYIAEAGVYLVPLRIGGGTRLKIFEALAMGKAVVSTSVGAEGLPLVPGEHFLQADDPASFARAVVSLLRDPIRRGALGIAGRQLVRERYSWAHVALDFEACCLQAVA